MAPVSGLVMWTIYERPADFPDHFVVRPHLITRDGPVAQQVGCLTDSLEQAREVASDDGWRHLIPRAPEDDPVIVETWL